MHYLIIKDNKYMRIIYLQNNFTGYIFHPKKKSNRLNISSVMIISPDIINHIFSIKLNRALDNFIKELLLFLENISGEEGTMIALDEIEKFKSICIQKYINYMKKESIKAYLNKLFIIETELKKQQIEYNYIDSFIPKEQIEQEKEKSR